MCFKIGNFNIKLAQYELVMADSSVKEATCMLEDVLVRIDELIVPVDFVIMNLEDNGNRKNEPYLLLGRPFMATTRMEINMRDGSVTMNVLGKKLRLDVFNNKSPPLYSSNDANYCFDEDLMK